MRIAGILGRELLGGEVIELIGDIGIGKTAFVRGLAAGIKSKDQVQSPSFTISRIYSGRNETQIHHYDFHRLDDPGILKQELAESLSNPKASVVVEWAERIADILPTNRLSIKISASGKNKRKFKFKFDKKYTGLVKGLNSQ